jgi:hypothetical protein
MTVVSDRMKHEHLSDNLILRSILVRHLMTGSPFGDLCWMAREIWISLGTQFEYQYYAIFNIIDQHDLKLSSCCVEMLSFHCSSLLSNDAVLLHQVVLHLLNIPYYHSAAEYSQLVQDCI